MIAWLDWAMLALVKVGGVIWLIGCVAVTASHTTPPLARFIGDAKLLGEFGMWRLRRQDEE